MQLLLVLVILFAVVVTLQSSLSRFGVNMPFMNDLDITAFLQECKVILPLIVSF